MEYVMTAEGDSVVQLGVKVYVFNQGDRKELHTTVFDREENYTSHIVITPSSARWLLSSSSAV